MLWCAVQEDIEMGADMQMAKLQSAGQGKHERYILLLIRLLADHLNMGRRPSRKTTSKGRVAVDVEFQQMEKRVVYHRDSTVHLVFDAVTELERLAGLVAGWKRDPLDLVLGILDMFAGLSEDVGSASVGWVARK